MSCKVIHKCQLTKTFEVKTGVRQGYLLSTFLFILVIDWVRKTTTKETRNGLEEVKHFRYLGSIVDTQGRTEVGDKKRISKASLAFHLLRNVWKSKIIGETTKLRLFNTKVKSVLLYGAETLRINKTTLIRIHTFVNHCLRRILRKRIHLLDRVSNKDIWDRKHQVQIQI